MVPASFVLYFCLYFFLSLSLCLAIAIEFLPNPSPLKTASPKVQNQNLIHKHLPNLATLKALQEPENKAPLT